MIERHRDGIVVCCKPENKVSLGFVEGLNNKIRVIQRRAYGLRDDEYLRLNVLTSMLPRLQAPSRSPTSFALDRILFPLNPSWWEFDNTLRTEDVAAPVVRGLAQDVTERKRAEEEVARQLDELRRWQAVMLGRESRNMEFKREVNALCRRLGEPVRYPSQAGGESAES